MELAPVVSDTGSLHRDSSANNLAFTDFAEHPTNVAAATYVAPVDTHSLRTAPLLRHIEMMARTNSRGHLYGTTTRPAIRVSLVIALFALAYAVLVLAMGIVPLNNLLSKLMAPRAMPTIWRNSMIQLAERTVAAAAACWLALAVSGRIRGRLTGSGMLALGAAMSGALAGAVDVGLHRLWVGQMVVAAHRSPILGNAMSLSITAGVALLLTLLFITRSTSVLATES